MFEVKTSTKTLAFPFSRAEPAPTAEDPVAELSVDAEAGREAFSYALQSGRTGTVHVEQVLEYNQDLCRCGALTLGSRIFYGLLR
jgi:hypothetical protein